MKIADFRNRNITFKKRLAGLMKKVHELGVLCDQDTFLFVRDRETQNVNMFGSSDEKFVPHYASIKQEFRKGPSDMQRYYEKKNKAKMISSPAPLPIQPPSVDYLRQKRDLLTSLLQHGRACERLLQAASSLRVIS